MRVQLDARHQLLGELVDGGIGVLLDDPTEDVSHLSVNRRTVTAAARPRVDGACLSVKAKYSADGGLANAQTLCELGICELLLVPTAHDRFAKTRIRDPVHVQC